MAITSLNDLVNALGTANSFIFPMSFSTTSSFSSGRFHFLNSNQGTHGQFSFTGTALQFVNCDNTTPGSLWPNRPFLNPGEFIYLTAWQIASNTSSSQPSLFYLIDVIGYYPGINPNTTAVQNLTGTVNLRGYDSAFATLVVTSTTGSATPQVTINYTNQSNVSDRTSSTITFGSVNIHGIMNRPFALNLQGTDTGIRSVQTIQFSSAVSGACALLLFRPLASIPLHVWNMATEREFLTQLPTLPTIPTNACLAVIQWCGSTQASSAVIFGNLFFTKG